jgi:flagellar biosynthesis/type III secretory pathway protein FliH
MSFDIVITVGPRDQGIVRKQLEYTRKNIVGYRHVYIICHDSTLQFDGCV